MAYDTGDTTYDASEELQPPRRSLYAPSDMSKVMDPFASAGVANEFPTTLNTTMPNPPELGRPAPPPNTITTDHMQPQSPLDAMLGKYNESENAYRALLEKGPDQFKPSIARRLIGAGLGTLAGMGGGRQGYGRYSMTSGNPAEAAAVTRGFVFGPQAKNDADYQRRVAAARVGSEDEMKNYQLMRQQQEDYERNRNTQSEIDARNKPSLVQDDSGRYFRVGPEGPATPVTTAPLPEELGGQQQLPEQLTAKDKQQALFDQQDKARQESEAFQQAQQQRNFTEQEKRDRERDAKSDARQDQQMRRMMLAASLPTSQEKTEYTRAGSVQDFSNDLSDKISAIASKFGPLSGRGNDFLVGKVGANDPDFSAWKTEANLAATRLMQLHTGNRPAQIMFEHFQAMLSDPKQTPQNLMANLKEIRNYADRISKGYEDKMQNASDYAQVPNPQKPTTKAPMRPPSVPKEAVFDPKTRTWSMP